MKTKEDLLKVREGLVIDWEKSKKILKTRYLEGIYEFNEIVINHLVNIEKCNTEIALIDYILEDKKDEN